jgi:hypothetical protein
MISAQLLALALACQTGSPDLCQTAKAIVLQESSACIERTSRIDRLSFGCMGLHLSTARMFDPGVTKRQLIHDDLRNIRDGVAFLRYCMAHTHSWRRGVVCFHVGLPHERTMTDYQINHSPYLAAIIRRMK